MSEIVKKVKVASRRPVPDDTIIRHRGTKLTDDQIKHMVDRFLGWRLPENFTPDAGISFKPTFNDHLPQPTNHNPRGTNLFDSRQADAMVRYMAEGLPLGAKT